VVQAKEEREGEEAREAAQREARRVIGGQGEGEDPAVAAVLRALEQCLFLGMRRKEFHGEGGGERGREDDGQASYFSGKGKGRTEGGGRQADGLTRFLTSTL
jgi:hypothetical protein